jgi:nitrate reductase NapE component
MTLSKRPATRGKIHGKRVNRSKKIFGGAKNIRSRTHSESRRMFVLVFMLSILAVVVAGGAGFLFWHEVPIATEEPLSIFMGEDIPHPHEWFLRLRGEAVFERNTLTIDTGVPGNYTVGLMAANRRYEGQLIIVDNTPPTATPVNVTVPQGTTLTPSDFYSDLFDHSPTESVFVKEPDTSVAGIHEVVVSIKDIYGNELIIEVLCEVFTITEVITIERGTPTTVDCFDLSDFTSFCEDTLLDIEGEVRLILNLPEDFYSTVGEHTATILVRGSRYYSLVRVIVTTPPTAEPRTVRRFINEPNAAVGAEAFVRITREDNDSDIDEETITTEFVDEPDWTQTGTHDVVVRVSDEWGNYTDVTATLELLHDTTPPVIHGANDFSILLGTTASFRSGVTVTDDLDPDPQLSVDSRSVNIHQIGVYEVTYTARDRAGNHAEPVVINVHVIDITEDRLNQLADTRLQELGVFDTNNHFNRIQWIHNYVYRTMNYQNNPSSPNDEVRFAYNVLRNMRGNCIASQRAAEVLLTRAGIPNRRIYNYEMNPGVRHAWNLVYLDGYWYHFDASRFRDCNYSNSHLFTAETATKLNRSRANVYVFNTENYPEIRAN